MTSAKVVRLFRKSLAKYVAMSILGLACIGSTLGQAASGDDFKAQIETLRKSLEKYQDYKVAVRDLYLSTVACVHYSGEKIEHHMEYAKGAMGVHFVNLTVMGPPDPAKPNVLIYEPSGGKLSWWQSSGSCRSPPTPRNAPASSAKSSSDRWRVTNR